ncbi:MAG TPA: Ku protein [Stellaceae bacterium]|nr:Ku protein [Stellaceae bacterium]
MSPQSIAELEPDEIAEAMPESDKTLAAQAFIARGDVGDIYFDRSCYLAPGTADDIKAFDLLRDGTYRVWTRFPVPRLRVWKLTFWVSDVAGSIAIGYVTRDSFR